MKNVLNRHLCIFIKILQDKEGCEFHFFKMIFIYFVIFFIVIIIFIVNVLVIFLPTVIQLVFHGNLEEGWKVLGLQERRLVDEEDKVS